MSIVEALMDGAKADTDVLYSLDKNGDNFTQSRDVDFLLRAPDAKKAQLVCDFINDHSYGKASVQEDTNVQVIINMPVTQSVILSVSAFFTCLSQIFSLEYDGWGCPIVKTNP